MPIMTFKVSKEIAETIDSMAKKTGLSRNEFLTRAVTSLLLNEELKGRDVRKLTASLIKKGLQKNESKARSKLEKSPFISSWIKIAPTLLSKLTRPPSKPVKDWELRILKDMLKVAESTKFSSDESVKLAVEVIGMMIKSISSQLESAEGKYSDQIKEAIFHLLFPLFYPDREKAAEIYLQICAGIKDEKDSVDYIHGTVWNIHNSR